MFLVVGDNSKKVFHWYDLCASKAKKNLRWRCKCGIAAVACTVHWMSYITMDFSTCAQTTVTLKMLLTISHLDCERLEVPFYYATLFASWCQVCESAQRPRLCGVLVSVLKTENSETKLCLFVLSRPSFLWSICAGKMQAKNDDMCGDCLKKSWMCKELSLGVTNEHRGRKNKRRFKNDFCQSVWIIKTVLGGGRGEASLL